MAASGCLEAHNQSGPTLEQSDPGRLDKDDIHDDGTQPDDDEDKL